MRRKSLITFIAALIYAISSFAQLKTTAYQPSEYSPARKILLHEPGKELYLGMLHPQAALFETYFNIEKSKQEHRNYVSQLNSMGIKTILVRDLLMMGCTDNKGETIESDEMKALRRLAFNVLRYDVSALSPEKQAVQKDYKTDAIAALSASELADILILQPTIYLSETETNTGITALYTYNPLMNLFYTRDQSITTPNGVIICKLNSPQRAAESNIIEFCYNKMGIKPILRVDGDKAFVEGGDFLLVDNCSFIGCGMRTTQEAIDQMMNADAFGTETVVVVNDRRFYQAEMHLDTYFNIIDRDLVTLGEERMMAQKGDNKYLSANIYKKGKNEKYKLIEKNKNFVDLLKDMKIKIIPVTPEDQAKLANNFLTVAPRTIMAVAGQSEKFQNQLKNHGVKVTWLPLSNLTKGYGAAHCMTQVIIRK